MSDNDAGAVSVVPTWLNLGVHGLYRDVRKLIYRKLDAFDRKLLDAHMSSRKLKLDEVLLQSVPSAATWACCSGGESRAVPWMSGRVRTRLWKGTWTWCSGREKTAARGTQYMQDCCGEWCCNGCGSMVVRGVRGRVQTQLWAGTLRCCSGRGSMAVRGTCGRAHTQLATTICRCCNGLENRAIRGTS